MNLYVHNHQLLTITVAFYQFEYHGSRMYIYRSAFKTGLAITKGGIKLILYSYVYICVSFHCHNNKLVTCNSTTG